MVDVPVRAFAIAASVSAAHFGENVADVFDVCPSRARMVAIAALVEIFPDASQVGIARCFGMERSGYGFSSVLTSARASAWWRANDADSIIEQIRRSFWGLKFDRDEPVEKVPSVDDGESRAYVYEKRKYRPARIASNPNPINSTSSFLGDPPPGRREFLASERHPYYSATTEGKPRHDISGNGFGKTSRSRKASALLDARMRSELKINPHEAMER